MGSIAPQSRPQNSLEKTWWSLIRFGFRLLYNEMAFTYDTVSWVVSLGDPSGVCEQEPSDDPTTAQIIQKKDGMEGSPNATMNSSASIVVFNGLGRVTTGAVTIDIDNPAGGACGDQPGQMRCMRVVVSTGGGVRMCDRQVTDATDPRKCP